MIKQISLKNFCSYQELDLELGQLNVIVGRNGSGKSNFLSFFEMVGMASDGELNRYIRNKGGFSYARHLSSQADEGLSWGITLESEYNEELRYDVSLHPMGEAGYSIASEVLSRPAKEGYAERYKFLEARNGLVTLLNASQTEVAQFNDTERELILPRLKDISRYKAQIEAHRQMKEWEVFQGFGDYEFNRIRQPQLLDVISPLRLANNGSNLISVLYTLTSEPRYDAVNDRLNDLMGSVFADFKKFDLRPVGGGNASLAYRSTHLPTSIPASLMSDGQLRFLGMLMTLLLPEPPNLILIDEPEIGMHPKMINVFAEVLKQTARHTQVIITTHSPQLLDNIPVDCVLVAERENGVSTITRPSTDDLDMWLEDYSLGYLWTQTTLLEESKSGG